MELTPLEPWIARKIGKPNQPFTRADLERYQLEKLRETIELARQKSIFYRKHLADAHESETPDDLARYPFTTAQDIRNHPLQFLCTSQDDIHRVVTLDTSGTTGDPKRIYFTHDDQELTVDFFHIGMSTFTAPGDRVLILLPCERPGSVGDLLAIALERLGAFGIKHGPGWSEADTLQRIARDQVTGIVGTPTQVLGLARAEGTKELRLKSVLLSTDCVPNAIVKVVEETWGCTVFNHYGMTEMGLGGGVECAKRRGYHLREADLFFEIVNPQTGMSVAEGETGEVVFTTLTRRGMPLIRYRTGDLSRFIPGNCSCGSGLKTLERITTRRDGLLRIGDSDYLTMAELDEAIFPIAGVVDFSATLERGTSYDCLTIEARVIGGFERKAKEEIQAALAKIPALTRAGTRLSFEVSTSDLSAPRTPGKRLMVQREFIG